MTAVASAMASDVSLAGAGSSTDTIPAVIRAPQDDASPASADTASIDNSATTQSVKPAIVEDQISAETAPSLAALVDAHGAPEELDEQTRCLAGAVYFEAKGESLAGQLAVARVIVNRMQSGRFAPTLCGVVYQRGQFSFVRGGAMPAIATQGHAWSEAVAISQIALADAWKNPAEGALFFHARSVSPGWNRARIARIDNHVFYR